MLLQLGFGSIAHNLGLLIRAEFGGRRLCSFNDFRGCFVQFLDILQPRSVSRNIYGVNYVSDVNSANIFRSCFDNDSVLDDKSQAEVISMGCDVFF